MGTVSLTVHQHVPGLQARHGRAHRASCATSQCAHTAIASKWAMWLCPKMNLRTQSGCRPAQVTVSAAMP